MPMAGHAQYLIKTYYDEDETMVKEEFFVRSKTNNILEGSYKSFFEAGGIKSEGQFTNNVSTGTGSIITKMAAFVWRGR